MSNKLLYLCIYNFLIYIYEKIIPLAVFDVIIWKNFYSGVVISCKSSEKLQLFKAGLLKRVFVQLKIIQNLF